MACRGSIYDTNKRAELEHTEFVLGCNVLCLGKSGPELQRWSWEKLRRRQDQSIPWLFCRHSSSVIKATSWSTLVIGKKMPLPLTSSIHRCVRCERPGRLSEKCKKSSIKLGISFIQEWTLERLFFRTCRVSIGESIRAKPS